MYYMEITLAGIMQSYGLESGGWVTLRDTMLHPTASTIVGILACSQGIEKDTEEYEGLKRKLNFKTTVLDDVLILEDYQIVSPKEFRKATADSEVFMVNGGKKDAAGSQLPITNRYILDAEFKVLVECENLEELKKIHHYLLHPVWAYYLGKACCTPSKPLVGREFKTTDLDEWEKKTKGEYICI